MKYKVMELYFGKPLINRRFGLRLKWKVTEDERHTRYTKMEIDIPISMTLISIEKGKILFNCEEYSIQNFEFNTGNWFKAEYLALLMLKELDSNILRDLHRAEMFN